MSPGWAGLWNAMFFMQCSDTVRLPTGKACGLQKSWVLVCWCWQFDWNLARLVDIHFSPPLPSSLAAIRSTMETFWYWLTEVIPKNCRFTIVVIITSGTSLFLWTSLCSDGDFCLCSRLRTVLLTYFRLHQVFGISQGVSKKVYWVLVARRLDWHINSSNTYNNKTRQICLNLSN